MNQILTAFALTVLAGLATGIGSFLAFFAKPSNARFLSVSLGFSAGVMIYVSMIEIFRKALVTLTAELGTKPGYWLTVISFFGGIFLIALIDKLIPKAENPHEFRSIDESKDKQENTSARLMRMGVFTALAIGIHNFPEGLATFVSALQDPSIAIPIVIAIALHNIPEGIAVSVPIYYATKDRKKAFWYSFLSGLSEPVGAAIGYVLLMPWLNDVVYGILYGAVAGIMVFISMDELLPSAREYGEHHLSVSGMVGGMMVMAVSLLLFL